jgi:hypothetical protein
MIMKTQIVYLNPRRVLTVVHESGMRPEFDQLVVVFKDCPGVTQVKSSYDYFAEDQAN